MTTSRTKKGALAGLSIAALGIVYGDIGTSPLYAVNQVFFGKAHLARTSGTIIGLISLIVWALILIVALKYVVLILRADNEGEGGVFALLSLIKQHKTKATVGLAILLTFAAGLLFGDGIITPAISVLSAVEGLKVITPSLTDFVVPITLTILATLFYIQKKGTAKIGRVFGPIILIWFVSIAGLGLHQIILNPSILQALNPMHAIDFVMETRPYTLLLALGSVMLVVTGGEALYADLGHFGHTPIRVSWFTIVMPCLLLSYLGQGAFLLGGSPVIDGNVFYSLVPQVMLLPMVLLATAATVIASQALISGCFSLATQGIALGLLPRLKIKQTRGGHSGQIYLGAVNWILFAGCVTLVLVFKSSNNLAAAYGLAVSAVMLVTAISATQVARLEWKWSFFATYFVFGFFAIIDAMFLSANMLKFFKGGIVPVLIGLALFIIMRTWQWGRKHVHTAFHGHWSMTVEDLFKMGQEKPRLERSVLVLAMHNPTKSSSSLPPLAELFVQRFGAVPKHFIILTVEQGKHPYVDASERYSYTVFENDRVKDQSVISIDARFGFMEEPDVEQVIQDIAHNDEITPDDDMKDWLIYAARERILQATEGKSLMHRLRVGLYAFIFRNTSPTYEYFGLGNDKRLSVEYLPTKIR